MRASRAKTQQSALGSRAGESGQWCARRELCFHSEAQTKGCCFSWLVGTSVFGLAEAQGMMPVSLFSEGRFKIGKGEKKGSLWFFIPQRGAGAPGE